MEDEIDLRPYVRVLISNWMWIAAVTLIAAATALIVSFLVPPTYEATALAAVTGPLHSIQFDPRIETADSIQPDYGAYRELATSDGLIRNLMAELDPLPEAAQTREELREILQASAGADPSIVRLAVRSANPEEAARVANAWVEVFVTYAREVYGAYNDEQVSFFENQLAQARAELDTAEQALVAFQARNQAAVLETQLASAQQDLLDYLVEQREIERAIRDAKALHARVAEQPPDAEVSPGDDLIALLLQIQAFSVRTSRPIQTSSRYVEGQVAWETGSPVVLEISDVALLSSEQTAGELAVLLDGLGAILEDRREEIEAQMAALEPQILSLQQQLQRELNEQSRLILARDVAQETFVTLTRKVEEARIAVEDTSSQVRLASRAGVPEKPVSPRKLLNTAVAGMLGLILGLFGTFGIQWWRGETTAPEAKQDNGAT